MNIDEWYNLVEVADADRGEGYDWEVFEVGYDPKARVYYVGADAGCSCNYPFDSAGPDTFKQYTTKEGVLRAFDEWVGGYFNSYFTPVHAQRFKQRVRDFKGK